MFKRLLAFTLAGCLVFDAASVTGYAAETGTDAAIESVLETDVSGTADGGDGFVESDEKWNDPGAAPAAEAGGLPLTKNEDGSYSFENETYRVTVLPEAGYRFLRHSVSMEAKGEQTLSGSFNVIGYYCESGSGTEEQSMVSLTSWNSYRLTYSEQVESGKSYEVYYVLKDSAGTVLATSEKLVLETEKTDKNFILHGITQTENSITIDAEISGYGNCYYAPSDDPDAEQFVSISKGWNKIELTGLQPGTEYTIQFFNSGGITVLFETKVSTAATSTEVVWQTGAAESGFGLSVKADVSKYAGDATAAALYCVYTNELGEEKTTSRWVYFYADNVTVAEDGTKSFSASNTLEEGLLADTEYEVTMWLEMGNIVYGKTTQKITTPHAVCSADDIEFIVGQREGDAKTIECKVTNKNTAGTSTSMKVLLCYRREGDRDSYKTQSTTISSTTSTIYLSQLEYGATYHYVLFAGGIMKELTQTFGAPEVKLTAVDEGEVNAFDIVRTWKAESAEGVEALSENYYLLLYYFDGNKYQQISTGVLNAENAYQLEVKTASNRVLLPDTDYELKWILGKTASAGTYDAALYTVYETVHTRKADFVIEDQGDISYNSRRLDVSLAQSDAVNLSENGRSLRLYGWIRKAGTGTFRQTSNVSLSSQNSFSGSVSFNGLEAGTTYEFSLRDSNSGYGTSAEYLSGTFATPKDERAVAITRVDAKLHSATLNYALSGILPAESYSYISCYIREKNEGSEWEKAGYNHSYSGTTGHTGSYGIDQYNGTELKDNTTYEYQIGFTSSYNAALSELANILAGEFTTPEDKRSLSKAGASAGYTTAQVGAMFSGNEYKMPSYINLFYREKGAEDWSQVSYQYVSQVSAEYTKTIDGLKPGAEYEYVIVIANNSACYSPEDVTVESRKATGEFATRKAAYTLSFAADESKLAHNRAVVTVSAKGSDADERVEVELELNNGLDGNAAEVTLKRSSGYTRNVTFTDLLGGTEYTITKAVLSVMENDSRVTIAELSCDYKFTTKAAQVPASLSLSQEKIGLNIANTGGMAYEGYNQITLDVKMEPGTAAADFVWESSNPEVAAVRNGVVSATGAGEAKITVRSAYDETVTASCDVVVNNYVIGYVAQAGADPDVYYYNNHGTVYKGGYVDGLGLYEQKEDGSLTLLPDVEVTTDRSGIVTWDSATGRLQTLSVGSVRLYMEKDNVKASFQLTVTAAGKGFGITGFTTSNSAYPAVAGDTADSYILACVPGIAYTATGEISPVQNFDPLDFTWKSSDENVATVSENGVVTPVKAGDVTLTVTPNRFQTLQGSPYVQESVTLTLHVRELPVRDVESIYALANTAVKIGDVAFPETWGEGWSWKYPDTPLVTNGVYTDNRYEFEAVYKDQKSGAEGRYPCEATLRVYIGRITGVSVGEETTGISHNGVLEVSDQAGTADALSLRVRPISQGAVSADSYVVEIPEISGLTITKNAVTGCFDITAGKAGSYTLKPVIKDKSTQKVLAQTSYKIKVMAQKQAGGISITVAESSMGQGVSMDSTGTIIFNSVDDRKDFVLEAKVKDRDGQEIDTALVWKTSDKSVATIAAASKQDSHAAKVTVKGEGHTVFTATSKDARGLSVSVNLEVRNHRPRVNTAKATVNIAYDYETSYGRSYAAAAGAVEIVPVYGESVSKVKLCDENGQESALLRAEYTSGYNYLITPAAAQISTGNYDCKLLVTTNEGTEYSYPLRISVVDKAPSVSAKMATAPNLFFTDSMGRINLTIGDNRYVESVSWEDQSEGVNNGFSMTSYYYTDKGKYISYIWAAQQSGLRVTGGKLEDPGVAQGTLTVKVRGYRKTYTFTNFKIKYSYNKPNVVTMSASSNVAPTIGQNMGWFRFYDKTNKRYLYFEEEASEGRYYDELTWDSEEVELDPSGADVDYRYLGSTGIKKLTMTLDSQYWREPIKAVHAIKVIKPQAYLSSSQLTFNTAAKSTVSVNVRLKNMGYNILYKDITIEGANSASKNLLDNDLLLITAIDRMVMVSMSDAEMMGSKIPAGSYKFKVTPYCNNMETGERVALNTLTLTVKVVDKPVTAKVSPKGALDLTYGVSSIPEDKKNYYVLADPKFSNKADGYSVVGYKLVGEYSDYFRLNYGYIRYANKWGYHYYIDIADRSFCKLKAGQTYKLAVEYTLKGADGERLTVLSNTFKIKPKQTAAKVTVRNNNQTLYAGSNLTRTYSLSVPSYYSVSSAYGSVDCNKDGRADITVSGSGTSLTVRIVDADAVGASASGKAYSIPVTVHLRGRDGVGKDAKVTVKVKVKR